MEEKSCACSGYSHYHYWRPQQKALPYFVGEKVVEVVDGDTFIIANRQPIRLYGLDAPELPHCLGQEAKEALSSLVLGKRVILREPFSDGGSRVMTLVYADGKLINEVMLRAGLAQYRRQGGSETDALKQASDVAKNENIGIYSPTCYQTTPPNPKCAIKGNYDERKAENIYTMPQCNYYSLVIVQKHQGDAWFCSEQEAKEAGFTRSVDCK
jgi:micrococcal nuclease